MRIHGMMLALLLGASLVACSESTTHDGGLDANGPDTAKPLDGPGTGDGPATPDGPRADEPATDRPARLDINPSSDAARFPKCSGKGGLCTKLRWLICPVNYEPIYPDPHQDCSSGGWCCVKAPSSTCSAKKGVNCVYGTTCTGCWGPASDKTLKCEAGRVCCEDICD